MTLEEINILLENLRDAVDKADRLADKLAGSPLYTKEMAQKVDKARLELENKIVALKAEREGLKNKKVDPENPVNPEDPKVDPIPEPPRDTILAPVGVKGKNDLKDVELVQKLLNERKGCKLGVDGKCGGKTNNEIIDLQRRLTQKWNVDGRIDPGGATWKWLKGTGALPALPPAPPVPPVVVPPVVPPVPIDNPKTLPEKIVDVLGEFSDKVLPYKKDFFKFDWSTPNVPIGYGFFIRGGIGAYSYADLKGTRGQNQVEITGSATIGAYASVTIGWGYSIDGWVFDTKVEASGTLRGDVSARFSIISTLTAQGQTLIGTLRSTADITAELSVSAEVIAEGHILGIGGSIGFETGKFSLGKITFLQASTPAYSMTYNFSAGKFGFSSSGNWTVYLHPTFASNLKRAAGL